MDEVTRKAYSAAGRNGARSKATGERGEALVRSALVAAGLAQVERVHTPFTILRDAHGRICSAFPAEKVSGDFRAVDPRDGRSVLIEAKTREDRVVWSDLEPHQIAALDAHIQNGARGILAVVIGWRVTLLEWPVAGFGPRSSIRAGAPGCPAAVRSNAGQAPSGES